MSLVLRDITSLLITSNYQFLYTAVSRKQFHVGMLLKSFLSVYEEELGISEMCWSSRINGAHMSHDL